MFKEIRKGVLASDEGFSVELVGRGGFKYTEGSKVFFVGAEMLAGPHGWVVYKKHIRDWESPPENYAPIDDKKRSEIVENIRRACLFWGFEIEIEDSY